MEIEYKVKLKKLKLEEDTVRKYNGKYELDNMIRNIDFWKYGEPMILDDEKILFSLSYYYVGDIAEQEDGKEWHGRNHFIFHIVEKDNKVLIKYLNLRGIERIVEDFARERISNLGVYQLRQQGLISKEYKNYIRKEAMKVVEIDKEDFYEKINKLSKIKYDSLEYFTCSMAMESIDYYDYINKICFYDDRFYPVKYTECVEFVNYILDKCKILNMDKVGLKPFTTEEEKKNIMIDLIKEKIIQDDGYLV